MLILELFHKILVMIRSDWHCHVTFPKHYARCSSEILKKRGVALNDLIKRLNGLVDLFGFLCLPVMFPPVWQSMSMFDAEWFKNALLLRLLPNSCHLSYIASYKKFYKNVQGIFRNSRWIFPSNHISMLRWKPFLCFATGQKEFMACHVRESGATRAWQAVNSFRCQASHQDFL